MTFFFFFSSRRRHTRCLSDWSSDVCSSDLFSLLDDHRYEYLECKTSHYQYHNKLRRWTCPQCPEAASNRYKELCWVARQWRNLKYRKWFWLLDNLIAKRGKMALFCAACPQDGVNLEPGWEAEQETNPYGFQNRYRFH